MKFQTLALSLLGLTLAAPLARADQLKYIKLPEQALAAFTAMANDSKRTIDMTTFIFEPCHASAQVMMEILAKKSKSGVRVRLLLDEITQSNSEKRNLADRAHQNGITLRWYQNPIIPNPGQNHRSHAKFMVVDNASYITGGRNIADEYFAMYAGPNFVDRDVIVRGASARQATASFEELWNAQLTGKPRGQVRAFHSWAQACGADESKSVANVKKYLAKNSESLLRAIPQRSCKTVNFLMDAPDFLNGKYDGDRDRDSGNNTPFMNEMRMRRKRVSAMILRLVQGTRSRLDMENWSYMPNYELRREFKKLRERRIPISVITNDDMDGPGIIKHAEEFINDRSVRKDSVGSQTIIQVSRLGSLTNSYSLTPKGASYRLHGKVFVRDNKDTVVGSYNIDPRSYHTNLETAVVVENCPSFANDVKSGMKDLAQVYVRDVKSGRIPPKAAKSPLAAIVGFLGFNFL